MADLSTARYRNAGSPIGTSTAALATGGLNAADSNQSATEEWSFSGLDPSTTPAASYADAIIGDFYYNSTTGQFKTVNDGGAPIGTWASGGSLNTGRARLGGAGQITAALAFGGETPGKVTNTEKYDGTSWTEVNDLNTARDALAGTGTQTAALASGGGTGSPSALTELWNGTSWSEQNDLNTARYGISASSCLLYTSPSPRDGLLSRMPSSA